MAAEAGASAAASAAAAGAAAAASATGASHFNPFQAHELLAEALVEAQHLREGRTAYVQVCHATALAEILCEAAKGQSGEYTTIHEAPA